MGRRYSSNSPGRPASETTPPRQPDAHPQTLMAGTIHGPPRGSYSPAPGRADGPCRECGVVDGRARAESGEIPRGSTEHGSCDPTARPQPPQSLGRLGYAHSPTWPTAPTTKSEMEKRGGAGGKGAQGCNLRGRWPVSRELVGGFANLWGRWPASRELVGRFANLWGRWRASRELVGGSAARGDDGEA